MLRYQTVCSLAELIACDRVSWSERVWSLTVMIWSPEHQDVTNAQSRRTKLAHGSRYPINKYVAIVELACSLVTCTQAAFIVGRAILVYRLNNIVIKHH